MENGIEEPQAALSIMRRWRWLTCDPDGYPLTHTIELNEAINRLAMEGQPKPHSAILNLLCLGDLVAVGDYSWKKYQWGNYFQHEDYSAELHANQWQTLYNLIEDEQRELEGHGWPFASVELEKLGMKDCSKYEWSFNDNRFTTALLPPETSVSDSLYFEEWFSAWSIEIRLRQFESPEVAEALGVRPFDARTAGRPLAAWWPDFVAELVAYTVEVGLPEGIGHQGQSEVIREVCSRLQARGKEEPSRSQIQEAVNAVLRRMRAAGN